VSEPLVEAKHRLREALCARRRAVSAETAEAAGRAVLALLEGWAPYRSARRVGLYAALSDELPLRACFEALRAAGRTALLPRVEEDGILSFRVVEAWGALQAGRYGVLAPTQGAERCRPGEGDLVLVPGVGFDRAGHRLGRGGGYYDRTFGEPGGAPLLCGVAYELQRVDAVPHGSHDRRMDAIVTERALYERTESG
jgi:5-formyltetrahydrofolate cyclo-ligase